MEGTLNYNSGTVAIDAFTVIEEVNLCRDLGAINRKAIHQTTSKGVPLVYHCRVTVYRTPDASDADLLTEVKAITIPQNWVFRNAAVKLHAARNKMFKKNGVTKSMLGRYASTIRYGWDGTDVDLFNSPLDIAGGTLWDESGSETWDLSQIAISTDTDLKVLLCGASHPDEEASVSAATFNLATAYLNSRKPVSFDDQTDSDTPAAYSIIRDMFMNYQAATDDEVLTIAEITQDHPPYDADDVDGPFTQCVEQGRCHTGQGTASISSMNVDVPFGLLQLKARRWNAGGTGNFDFRVDVLGVSEMQG
jgi:hypothetical protein